MMFVNLFTNVPLRKTVKIILLYVNENKFISSYKLCLQPNMFIELAATFFRDNIRKHLDKGCLLGAIFIDVSKTFDTNTRSVVPNYTKYFNMGRW